MKAYQAYQAVFVPSEDGGFEVSFPQFPGCVTFGTTFEEAQKAAAEALGLWIEELEAHHAFDNKKLQKNRPVIAEVTVSSK